MITTMRNFLLPILMVILTAGLLTAQESELTKTLHAYADLAFWQPIQKKTIQKKTIQKKSVQKKTIDITNENLIEAIELARTYILNHQKTEGNFVYSVNLQTESVKGTDNQVRQAGALWSVSFINRYRFNEQTFQALIKGLDFFANNIKELPTGQKCITYLDNQCIQTGTVAIYCLALMDLLEGKDNNLADNLRTKYRELLDMHIDYLKAQELENGSWSKEYDISTGIHNPEGSSYFDGESLYAYCRAARTFNRQDLLPRIQSAIPKLVSRYCVDALNSKGPKNPAHGFYQWACLAFAEYTEAGWPEHRAIVRDAAMTLSWWQIYKNNLPTRKGNTGYAIEGIVSAYRVADAHQLQKEKEILKETAMSVLKRLMPLQYKGPFMSLNPKLSSLTSVPPLCEGGITSGLDSYEVRIDTVQHQAHAMLLFQKYLLP